MLLGEPEESPYGWVRYAWKAYDEKSLDKVTKMGMWEGSNSDIQTAWHGTKFECPYKTMVDGNLCEVDEPGRRIKDGKPGIYMMSTKRREKAEWYSRYVCLNDDGIWIRLVWEHVTDRHDSVASGNDQCMSYYTHLTLPTTYPFDIYVVSLSTQLELPTV